MHGVSLLEVRGLEGARTIAKNEVRLTHFSRDNEFFIFGTDLFGRRAASPAPTVVRNPAMRRHRMQNLEQLKLDRQVLLRVLAEVVEHLYEGDMNIL
jgi:hypothetical protein